MPDARNPHLLEALLDSWDRNNRILVNLLQAIPSRQLETKARKDGPTVAELFTHIHYVRLVFVEEDVPEAGVKAPKEEWKNERDPARIAQKLNESAKVVRDVVKKKIETGQEMKIHYDHPLLMLQHMIWHEGYHHGQIKLALKLAGHALSDDSIGPVTWDIWMDKK